MSARGDARRALLGEDLVRAARDRARDAPPPSPELLAQLRVLFRNPRARCSRDAA